VANLLRGLVTEGRNAVHGLRTREFDAEDLARAISAVPDDLQIPSTAQFRVVIEGKPRPLLPAAGSEIYLIAREAISNGLRHAQASIIDVSLEYFADRLRLTVRDDGRGFAAHSAREGRGNHFGLAVMNERAERLGAVMTLSSGVGAGTEIVLSVPGAASFRPEATRKSSG
jgi:signal transduction histidine kinase